MKIQILSLLLLASSILAMEPEEKVIQQESEHDIFQSLPPELKVHLFSYVATADSLASILKEFARLSLVNKEFRAIAQDQRFNISIAKEYVKHNENKAYQEFWTSVKKGNEKLIELLVKGGVNPNKLSLHIDEFADGALPLSVAVIGTKPKIVKLFNKLGANPNAKDKDGNTVLHNVLIYIRTFGAFGFDDRVTPSLLALCDYPSLSWQIPNKTGKTAADLAKSFNFFDSSKIGKILQKCLYEHRKV